MGERIAADYLKKLGYQIVEKNFRNRFGEIDIIAWDFSPKTLCFVEVKTRTSYLMGDPLEAITTNKQRKLACLAWTFLKTKKMLNTRARFDIVSIVINGNNKVFNLVKNAFEVG